MSEDELLSALNSSKPVKKGKKQETMEPQQQLFNNVEKVQFWAKFDLLTPMGPGQEFFQRQHIHSPKCLISV